MALLLLNLAQPEPSHITIKSVLCVMQAAEETMNIFNTPISMLPKSVLFVLLLAADLLLVYLDGTATLPIPFMVFYIVLMHACVTRVDRNWAYLIALISALGRTYAASKAFPSSEYLTLSLWQFEKSGSVLFVTCYLLNITHRQAGIANLKTSLAAPQTDLTLAAMHGIPAANGSATHSSTIHSRKTRQTATKLLLSSIGAALAMLPSSRIGGISNAYAVDVDFAYISEGPAFSGPLADDEATLENAIVLTVDDGPRNSVADRKILNILKRHSAKAVWLVNCIQFDSDANPRAGENLRTLLQIQREGHLIGNHTYSHRNLRELAVSDHSRMVWEIEHCSSSIESATGSRPKYFRAPFGDFTPEVIRTANNAGMVYMQWSVGYDSLFHYRHVVAGEQAGPSEDEIRQLSDSVKPGTIILMHDDERTAGSLDAFLSNLEQRGYKFVLPPGSPEVNQQS